MSVFLEIAALYALADSAFAEIEQKAFQENDDATFDRAAAARQRNDQAYFLHLFSRYEALVNSAVELLLTGRLSSATPWSERRVWQAWSRTPVRDIALSSKVEVLTDKARQDYATAKQYYDGRNTIAHGGTWEDQFSMPSIAQMMHDLSRRFVVT